MQKARAAADRGDLEETLGWLEEAARQKPFHLEANAHLAWLRSQRGEYARALRVYARLMRHAPLSLEVHARAAQCLWYAWRQRWGRIKENRPALKRLTEGIECATFLLAEIGVRWLEARRGHGRIVSDWMSHHRRWRKEAGFNAYEYYKIAEVLFVTRCLLEHPRQRVLDLGSGRSAFPSYLLKTVDQVHVGELEWETLRMQNRLAGTFGAGRMQAAAGNFLALPYRDETFDAITLISTIEHVPGEGDRQAMKEMARVLRHGGDLLITTPAGTESREQWTDHAIGHVYAEASDHGTGGGFLRVYDRPALESRLVEASGLKPAQIRLYGETSRWGWLGLGRNFIDHRRIIHPSRFSGPLSLLFTRELTWEELPQAHWAVACLQLRKA